MMGSPNEEPDFGDLLAAVPGITVVDEAEDDALEHVARRIAGQHAELLARFAHHAFANVDSREFALETLELIGNLIRLAKAANHGLQVELLEELAMHAKALSVATGRQRARQRALVGLRDWIPRFAQTLDPDDAKRLVGLIAPTSFPLRGMFRRVRGVGRARSSRLYAAGLHTLGAVVGADPDEIAEVTGMPSAVSARVVDAAHQYARDERERCLTDMRSRALAFEQILSVLPMGDEELRESAREALICIQRALETLENSP